MMSRWGREGKRHSLLRRGLIVLAILQDSGPHTLERLTEKVNVVMVEEFCQRTIRRDLDALVDLGERKAAAATGRFPIARNRNE